MGKMAASAVTWEELKRRATQLEGEIGMKLISFSKLGPALQTPQGDTGEHVFETMASEIQQLIDKFASIVDQLAVHAEARKGPAFIHTANRYRNLLDDMDREFRKLKANLVQARERETLLSSVQQDISSYRRTQQQGTSYYDREQSRLYSSHQMVNDSLSIAMETRDDLVRQRMSFGAAAQRLRGITARIPGLNTLMRHIDLKKRKDNLIVAAVVALCICVCLWYLFA